MWLEMSLPPLSCVCLFLTGPLLTFPPGGALYIRWGRKSCPLETDVEKVYSGKILSLLPGSFWNCIASAMAAGM